MTRLLGIDLLRGLSILYIVGFWHLCNYTKAIPNYNNAITYRLTLIVLGTFVTISGYFIGKKNIAKQTLFNFYKRRFLRIYPLYFIAIIIFTLFGLSSATTSVKAALGVSMFIKPAPLTLWFITMLIIFYIISPFLMLSSKQGEVKYLIIFICLFGIFLTYGYISDLIFNYSYLDIRIVVYLAPFMVGIYLGQNEHFLEHKNRLLSISVILSLLSFVISLYLNSTNREMNLLYSVPLITFAPLLFLLFFKKFSIQSIVAQKAIGLLSAASYCMYLYHRPIYIIMKKLYFPHEPIKQLFFLCVVCLPLIITISYIIQKTYDNIIKSLTKR